MTIFRPIAASKGPALLTRAAFSHATGALPHQLAALNLRQITVHQVAVDAALTGKKDYIYQAAMLDPRASAELSIDEIRAMVDDLIEAHGDWLPKYH